jgi:non-ribosomal peptide synthetase component F
LWNVVFGAAFSGRPVEVPRIDSLVGPCVNNLPVRVTITPGEAFSSWLSGLQLQQFELAGHQYAPLQQIQAWAELPWRYRLFDSLLVFQNYRIDEAARRLGSDVAIVPVALPEATNYPLTVVATPNAALHLRLIYQRDRLTSATAGSYARDLATMLRAIAQRPERTLAQLLEQLPAATRSTARPLATVAATQPLSPYVAPETETERAVASLWQELFGVERISLDANFFDLGGHSLLLLQAHSRLRDSLRAELPVVALLQFPTIRTLARHLSGAAAPVPDAARARAEKQRDALRRRKDMAEQR